MVARNDPYRSQQSAGNAKPLMPALTERLRHCFDQRPQESREDFVLSALRHEIDSRRPLSVDDVRIHAWIAERQALVDRERSGWRAKMKRFFGY